MRIALYQPDIPQNTGTILRLAACFGIAVDIIEPCGFALSDARMRRAGMDYVDRVDWTRHVSWDRFRAGKAPGRLVLLTTKAAAPLQNFVFEESDTLLFGRESAGVPDEVHDAADARVLIPMRSGLRSLNIAVSASIALWEALRQTGLAPSSHGR
ncbi:tRNA (cytidine(34)-2'-O)-methyltransferase [Nisaea acidiphila]|uniref:tRNA (cytidine(34)-2'-O)-methyltransferase n=1 Tax=Nisaea acidiphila TaxID=1862145 RepID=A0A9J7AWG8_9PROT|nr:tRNA (cytidine(34)-2'-O)-methyltransferase [Nisaea acidiphila]UUX51462.1 tRNA (cytidine(34)-2'-O)-methyltransferase [Nisaea acidiphila]